MLKIIVRMRRMKQKLKQKVGIAASVGVHETKLPSRQFLFYLCYATIFESIMGI